MAQIRHRIVLATFLVGLSAPLAHGVALAQSPATLSQHRAIKLTSQKIALPFGNQVFAGGDAAQLANSHCLLCHSKGMIDTQPPLTVETWKKEIDKMRAAYGCPLRADQTAGIAKFVSQAISAPAA